MPGPFGPPEIDALSLSKGRLYLGGTGFFYADEARPPIGAGYPQPSSIVALDTRTARAMPWVPRKNGYVGSLAVGDVETILIEHGEVLTAGRDGWGVSSARTGRDVSWGDRSAARLFTSNGKIVCLAGDCRDGAWVAGKTRHNFAAINVATGQFTDWSPNVAPFSCVQALAASSTQVLVAGTFTATLG